jgi:hypothetical protein
LPSGPTGRAVDSAGASTPDLRHAIERGNVVMAEATARELRRISLEEALALTALVAEKDARESEMAYQRGSPALSATLSTVSLAFPAAMSPDNSPADRLLRILASSMLLYGVRGSRWYRLTSLPSSLHLFPSWAVM